MPCAKIASRITATLTVPAGTFATHWAREVRRGDEEEVDTVQYWYAIGLRRILVKAEIRHTEATPGGTMQVRTEERVLIAKPEGVTGERPLPSLATLRVTSDAQRLIEGLPE